MDKRIKIYGHAINDAAAIIYVNDTIVFQGVVTPADNVIADVDVNDVNLQKHNSTIKVHCLKGIVGVGIIDTNYCQDINSNLSLDNRRAVWQSRQQDTTPPVKEPYMFYPNSDAEFESLMRNLTADERFNIIHNGNKIDIYSIPDDPEHKSYRGWVYQLEEGETLQFDFNVFRPYDLLDFIIEQEVGEEFFDDEQPLPFAY